MKRLAMNESQVSQLLCLASAALMGCAMAAEPDDGTEAQQVSQALTASVSLANKLVQVAPRSMLVDSVTCPAGTVLVGGGYNAASTQAHVFRSYRRNGAWELKIDNESDGNQTVNIIAQCLAGTTATAADVQVSKGLLPGQSGCAFVECTSGIIASGGFYATTDVDIYSSRPLRNGWSVCGKNRGVAPIALQATGVCVSNFSATHGGYYADAVAAPNQYVTATANCREGGLRTGGGFEYAAVDSLDTPWSHASFQSQDSWLVRVRNTTSTILPFKAHVNCLTPR